MKTSSPLEVSLHGLQHSQLHLPGAQLELVAHQGAHLHLESSCGHGHTHTTWPSEDPVLRFTSARPNRRQSQNTAERVEDTNEVRHCLMRGWAQTGGPQWVVKFDTWTYWEETHPGCVCFWASTSPACQRRRAEPPSAALSPSCRQRRRRRRPPATGVMPLRSLGSSAGTTRAP